MCVHMHVCHSTHGIRTTWEWVLVPPIVFRNWNQLISLAICSFTWLAISGSLWSPSPALPSAPVSSHMDLCWEPGPHLPQSKTPDISNETCSLAHSALAVSTPVPLWPPRPAVKPSPVLPLLLFCTLFLGFVWFRLKKKKKKSSCYVVQASFKLEVLLLLKHWD